MEIEFEFASSDAKGIANLVMRAVRSPGMTIYIGVMSILCITHIPVLLRNVQRGKTDFGTVFVSTFPYVFLAAFLFFMFWFLPRNRARYILRMPWTQGRQRFWIDESGFHLENQAMSQTYRWPYIHNLGVTATMIFIESTPKSYMIIPKRVFASEEAALEFFAEMQRLWRAQTQTEPIASPAR